MPRPSSRTAPAGRRLSIPMRGLFRDRYHWAIANIAIALLCAALVGAAFMTGYVLVGLLIIVVSFALVVNAGLHKKRGDVLARDAEHGSGP